MTDDKIIDALIASASLIRDSGTGEPQDVFHPLWGWIIKDGEPTVEGKRFYEELMKNG